jgi:hypothetical protein
MGRLFVASLVSVVLAGRAISAPAPEETWGKAGISLDRYREDSVDCGLQGYYTDISKTEDAQELVRASRQLDTVTAGAIAPNTPAGGPTNPATVDSMDQALQYAQTQQHIVESVRPDERFRNIKKSLISNTERCLIQRGYSKLRLTDDQRHRLRKLKFGSEERREYLYSLATNRSILARQKVSPEP